MLPFIYDIIMSKLTIQYSQTSDKGIKAENQDCYGLFIPDNELLETKGIAIVIADGVSHSEKGGEASQACVKGFLHDYYSTPESWSVKKSVEKVLSALNTWLYSQGRLIHNTSLGMVSTLSIIILKSTTAYVFHIGDSRIYRFRDGNLEQITRDHRVHYSDDRNYLSRAMGVDLSLDIDHCRLSLEINDIFLLSTDGVHDFITDSKLRHRIKQTSNISNLSQSLVDMAKHNQSDDNITCQIIQVLQLPSQQANEVYQQLTELPFPPELEPNMVIDAYQVMKEIYASPSSQLYLVKDQASKQQWVMKTPSVNFSDDPAYIERFLLEEWVGKRIQSKHVLKVIPLPRKRYYLYYLMEYMQGQTLEQWMMDNPQPDLKTVIALVEQIIMGLRAFHRLEMLHQDLKPSNIMIDSKGVVKIIDFGSTKIAGIQEISTPIPRQHLLGTKNYTAPEYLLGQAGSVRSDLFALGIITYEMLNHALPYGDALSRDINYRRCLSLAYTPSIQHNPMVPIWVDQALKKAVQCNPQVRYQELSEFLYDLKHPNPKFMQNNFQPLLEKNPLAVWQGLSGLLFLFNLGLLYLLLA